MRITFPWADAATGAHVRAERYDRELKDVFALLEEIVGKVCVAVDVKILQGSQMVGRRNSTRSIEAYRLNRKAYDLWHEFNRYCSTIV